MYGFHKIPHLQQGVLKSESDTEHWNFEHPSFRRGQPDLLCLIQRKKQAAQPMGVPGLPSSTDGSGALDFGADVGPIPSSSQPLPLPPSGGAFPAANGQVLDISSIVNGVAAVKRHQATISAELSDLKASNEHLWQEALAARERHKKHQDTINRILKFLAGVFGQGDAHMHQTDSSGRGTPPVIPRKRQRLMITDGGGTNEKEVQLVDADMDDVSYDTNSGLRDVSPNPIGQLFVCYL
jgi:hypothetical protein